MWGNSRTADVSLRQVDVINGRPAFHSSFHDCITIIHWPNHIEGFTSIAGFRHDILMTSSDRKHSNT